MHCYVHVRQCNLMEHMRTKLLFLFDKNYMLFHATSNYNAITVRFLSLTWCYAQLRLILCFKQLYGWLRKHLFICIWSKHNRGGSDRVNQSWLCYTKYPSCLYTQATLWRQNKDLSAHVYFSLKIISKIQTSVNNQ